jgi:hypothetical protein
MVVKVADGITSVTAGSGYLGRVVGERGYRYGGWRGYGWRR